MRDRYIVTEEVKSQTRVFKYVYVSDFLFLCAYAGVVYAASSLVSAPLIVPYIAFAVFAAIFLLVPSVHNKGRRNWQAVFILFTKDRNVYKMDELVSYRRDIKEKEEGDGIGAEE